MARRLFFLVVVLGLSGGVFGQTSALRDYVGMISQGFHPDINEYLQRLGRELEKDGYENAVKDIENYLKGDSGTGFVYVAEDGTNYMITNYHVISHALTLSVTFEKPDGEKTRFSDLRIIAADEEMDIALLAFAGGQNPFSEGLAFVNRSLQEGDDVYSAGFPGLGTSMIWQLGRGMISNVSVRLPDNDDPDKMIGPFIQHTAQVDPGNSGGPLMVQVEGVPTGFGVIGINTLSARFRQAANYAIPLNRVQAFIESSLQAPAGDQRPLLESRVNAFIEGLSAPKAVYPHIAPYLSNSCTGENAEYAISEVLEKASRNVRNDIFDRAIVSSMNYAVAWTIENAIRARSGTISIALDSIVPGEADTYTVTFNVNNGSVSSVWINEYGIWRIRSFGDVAAGDKTLIKKKKEVRVNDERLRAEPALQISAGFSTLLSDLPAAFGAELAFKTTRFTRIGFQGNFGKDFNLIEIMGGLHIPIKAGKVAFTPFADACVGVMFGEGMEAISGANELGEDSPLELDFMLGGSIRGGLQFTTAAVPGLYLQASYQQNWFKPLDISSESDFLYPSLIHIGIGYSFN